MGVRASISILTYGDYLSYYKRCLHSVLATVPHSDFELRLGFNASPEACAYTYQLFSPRDRNISVGRPTDGVERVVFRGDSGLRVSLYIAETNVYKNPLNRLMYHDRVDPLTAPYAIWFDDDSWVKPGWWEALTPLMDRGLDYIGQFWWIYYAQGQTDMIRDMSWYRGVPFEQRQDRDGVRFATGGFMALKRERIIDVSWPDTETEWRGQKLLHKGEDTLLGQIARQLDWKSQHHDHGIRINVDMDDKHPAPRRGYDEKPFGATVDIRVN